MVSLKIDTLEQVPSVSYIYLSANWLEREVWDMFGCWFQDHPDLRRILTDYGFNGHPLRKDFPITGFTEPSYDDALKITTSELTQLTQLHRPAVETYDLELREVEYEVKDIDLVTHEYTVKPKKIRRTLAHTNCNTSLHL